MKIKPNQLCELVGTGHPSLDGRFVVTVRYFGAHVRDHVVGFERHGFLWMRQRALVFRSIVEDAWEVSASWADEPCYVSAKCLKPITDPDQPVTETTDEEVAA